MPNFPQRRPRPVGLGSASALCQAVNAPHSLAQVLYANGAPLSLTNTTGAAYTGGCCDDMYRGAARSLWKSKWRACSLCACSYCYVILLRQCVGLCADPNKSIYVDDASLGTSVDENYIFWNPTLTRDNGTFCGECRSWRGQPCDDTRSAQAALSCSSRLRDTVHPALNGDPPASDPNPTSQQSPRVCPLTPVPAAAGNAANSIVARTVNSSGVLQSSPMQSFTLSTPDSGPALCCDFTLLPQPPLIAIVNQTAACYVPPSPAPSQRPPPPPPSGGAAASLRVAVSALFGVVLALALVWL